MSVSLTKGQLAGAVIILVTSLIYVGIYIYVYIRALGEDERMLGNISSFSGPHIRTQAKTTTVLQHPSYSAEPPIDYSPQPLQSQSVICHRCGATVQMGDRF